ncbi:MAG: divisome protein SepX/GlpR [Jatrophihabitans sp.]
MPSPFMTVVILTVLWLIVVVPMVLRRNDEKKRERSVAEWGQGMRALGRRAGTANDAGGTEVFVPRRSRPTAAVVAPLAAPARRPVPAAQEALMYPPDRTELSEARADMLARRRRSLVILLGGSVVFGLAALGLGGTMWLLATPFLLGLAGYLLFLRNQALRDRSRRENRQLRAASRRPVGYDATEESPRFEGAPESVVRIDDDDIELHSMDTIDLTGLYNEEAAAEAMQRRAS